MENKFDFYDVVTVHTSRKSHLEINGCKAAVLGMAQNEETGRWGYSVSIYEDDGYVWHVMEDELTGTGKKAKAEDFETDETVKVVVDPKTGEGSLED